MDPMPAVGVVDPTAVLRVMHFAGPVIYPPLVGCADHEDHASIGDISGTGKEVCRIGPEAIRLRGETLQLAVERNGEATASWLVRPKAGKASAQIRSRYPRSSLRGASILLEI